MASIARAGARIPVSETVHAGRRVPETPPSLPGVRPKDPAISEPLAASLADPPQTCGDPAELPEPVHDAVPELLAPETCYARGVLEPFPDLMLTIRHGPDRRPMAHIEVPRMGAFLPVQAVTPRGRGAIWLMPRPLDAMLPTVPDPAFLPKMGEGIHSKPW